MARIASYDDLKSTGFEYRMAGHGDHVDWVTSFSDALGAGPDGPQAFLAQSPPGQVLDAHFHEVDQFQIMYLGGGHLASHRLGFGGVHFSRAYTPYGPIVNGDDGIGFVTLRARKDPGPKFVAERRELLAQVPDRTPWQMTEMARFAPPADDFSLTPFEHIRDDRGLAGYAVALKPGAKAVAPAPSGGGQYIVVMNGALMVDGREKPGLSVIWVAPGEAGYILQAGSEGLDAIVVNFPVMNAPAKPTDAAAAQGDFKTYQCLLCGVIYEEAAGMPHHGIAPGTRWADVPDSFLCPDCSTTKADFEMVEV